MSNFLRRNLPIISIIVLGALLRFYRLPEYMIFLGDEGRDALAVYNILHGQLTLLGPTASVGGFFLGPIYYYLIAPSFFLSNYHPAGPGYMVALFGLATIFLVYYVGKSFFNRSAGLIGAFLYSIAPTVIFYSRSSWNPNVLPFFSLATLITLYKAFQRKSRLLFLVTGFLLGISLQLHYLATFLGAIVFIYTVINEWFFKKSIKLFFFGVISKNLLIFVGFLVGFSPFLLFELRHGFQNTQNVIRFIASSQDTGVGGQIGYAIVFVANRLFGGLVFNLPIPSNYHLYPKELISIWSGLAFTSVVACLAYVFSRIKLRDPENLRKYSLLLVWGFFGIILFGMYKKSIYDYYLAFLFPLPFILVGALSSRLIEKRRRSIASLIAGFIIVLSASSAIYFSPIRITPNNQYNQVKTISEFILTKSGEESFNFALISAGNSDHAYRFIFKLEGKEAVVIETSLTDPDRRTVTDQLFVLCDYKNCHPLGNPLWEVAGFGQAKIEEQWDTSVGKLYKLVHDDSGDSARK